MNLETHEEITSFELVRLVEGVGPDVTGIVFDTANLLLRVEHPGRRRAGSHRTFVRRILRTRSLAMEAVALSGSCVRVEMVLSSFEKYFRYLPRLIRRCTLVLRTISPSPINRGLGLVISSRFIDAEFLAGHPDLSVTESPRIWKWFTATRSALLEASDLPPMNTPPSHLAMSRQLTISRRVRSICERCARMPALPWTRFRRLLCHDCYRPSSWCMPREICRLRRRRRGVACAVGEHDGLPRHPVCFRKLRIGHTRCREC